MSSEDTTSHTTNAENKTGEHDPTKIAEEVGGKIWNFITTFFYLIASFFLCLSAGVFSGLTVGYLSISDLELDIKIRTGS